MRFRASNRSMPRSSAGTRPPASATSFIAPYMSMTTGDGRECRRPTSKSFASCAGVIFTAPVPNSGSAYSSATTNRQIHDRQQDIPPDERRIPFVARVHGHGDVAEHRLGARRGDDDAARGIVLHRIGDVVEGAARLLAFGLFVGKGRQAARTPVNHAVSPIDEPTLEKAHEALAHRDAQLRAERVRRAGPVRRRADGLELLEDDSARLKSIGTSADWSRTA